MKTIAIVTLVSFISLCTSSIARQHSAFDRHNRADKPLWEAGVFAARFSGPTYPAAVETDNNVIAAPYVIYRGEVFRLGDGAAARAVAIDTDWLEVDLSLDAAFNVDSDDNSVRTGMPDLDYVFEVGPQIKLKLADYDLKKSGQGKLQFKLQTRAAFSTDFSSIAHRGYVLHPELNYQHSNWFQAHDRMSLSVSAIWASEKLHDYFYQVQPHFATPQRHAFDANGGYLGSELSASYMFELNQQVRVFFSLKQQFYQHAQNRDSPLFFKDNTYSFALGFTWWLYQSRETAPSH